MVEDASIPYATPECRQNFRLKSFDDKPLDAEFRPGGIRSRPMNWVSASVRKPNGTANAAGHGDFRKR